MLTLNMVEPLWIKLYLGFIEKSLLGDLCSKKVFHILVGVYFKRSTEWKWSNLKDTEPFYHSFMCSHV